MLKYILQQTNAIRSRKTISVDEIKIHNISDEEIGRAHEEQQ